LPNEHFLLVTIEQLACFFGVDCRDAITLTDIEIEVFPQACDRGISAWELNAGLNRNGGLFSGQNHD
jgi:hypothetical protein